MYACDINIINYLFSHGTFKALLNDAFAQNLFVFSLKFSKFLNFQQPINVFTSSYR